MGDEPERARERDSAREQSAAVRQPGATVRSPGGAVRARGKVGAVVVAVLLALAPGSPAGAASSGPSTAAGTATGGSASWTWPLPGLPPVTRRFDPPAHRYGRGHRGVDLAGQPGAAVLAAGPGVVGYAGVLAGRGVVVVVHGELRTTYEPVTAEVAAGHPVARGQRLGTLAPGHLGCPAPACLHWGLRRGEQYLDPLALVGRGPVRLLPLEPRHDPGDTGLGRHVAGRQLVPDAPGEGAARPAAAARPDPPAGDGGDTRRWTLRSAPRPAAGLALALAALLAGLVLLRPRRPPPRRAGAAARQAPAAAGADGADVVDLTAERSRRRLAG